MFKAPLRSSVSTICHFRNRDSTDFEISQAPGPTHLCFFFRTQETSAMQSCWNGSFGSTSPYTMSTIWQPMLLKAEPKMDDLDFCENTNSYGNPHGAWSWDLLEIPYCQGHSYTVRPGQIHCIFWGSNEGRGMTSPDSGFFQDSTSNILEHHFHEEESLRKQPWWIVITCHYTAEGILEVKLRQYGQMKQRRWEEAEKRKSQKRRSQRRERKAEGRRSRCAKRYKSRKALCFSNVLWLRKVEK